MQLWRRHPWLLRGLALLASAVGALLPPLLAPNAVSGVEERAADWAWQLSASQATERRVVLVDIDEPSLAEIGPWPWARATMAELSSRLASAGVRVQAYDIAFPDQRSDDDALRAAWSGAPAVVAQVLSIDPLVTPTVGTAGGGTSSSGCPPFAPNSFGYYGTSEILLQARPAIGHITPRIGSDGVVRQMPALICQDGAAVPSLAMAMLWRAAQPEHGARPATGRPHSDWVWHASSEPSPFPTGLGPAAWLTSPSLPGVLVPLDGSGNLRVPFSVSRQALLSVSAADVIKGRADRALLNGAMVIVGATAFGIGDTVATPLASVAAGLEVHAQTLVGLLDQRIPYTPERWPIWQALALIALASVLIMAAVQRRGVPAKRLPLIGLGLSLAVLAFAGGSLVAFAIWLPWLTLVIFCVLASVSLATVEHALVRAQRERLSAHLGAYLPGPVAQHLMASDPSGSLQLEPRSVCVLVAEIRNFTALATHGDPAEVASLLHAYCCLAVEIIERHGGVVDNVVGDCIVAIWPGSADSATGPARALAAAQDLVRETRPLLASRHPVADDSLIQPLALGVGLEAGVAIVGSFGPSRRRAHAALGEPVSVANRIQQMTADVSIPVLIGPQLAGLLPGDQMEVLGDYLLEGLGKHYRLFVPVGWSELTYVDSNWASSAVGDPGRVPDASEWSRWSENPTRYESAGPGLPGALAAFRRRSA